jgi:putative membrane protein
MLACQWWRRLRICRDAGGSRIVTTVHSKRGRFARRQFLHTTTAVFAAWWALLAIRPLDRRDWWLENSLVFFIVLVLALTYRKYPLSNLSYLLIAVYLGLHEVGAHYSYEEVPFGYWLQSAFHLQRNPYDRIVHFAFGLLLTYPFRDAFLMTSRTVGFWSYFFPANIVMSLSAIYEIIEAYVAMTVHPGLGTAFLGMQGDLWDSQRDMTAALVGTVSCMLIAFGVNEFKRWRVLRALSRRDAAVAANPAAERGRAL